MRTVGLVIWLAAYTCNVEARLNINVQYDTEAVDQKPALLPCTVETDKRIKLIAWYRLLENSPRTTIYYFEPPRYNSSSSLYKDRVHLAGDKSSLVINSVTRNDEGLYECRVQVVRNGTDYAGEIPEEASKQIKLTVHVPPSNVKISSFSSNKNMTLSCQARGSKPPAEIDWLVEKDEEIKKYPSAKIVTENRGNIADTIGYYYVTLSHKDNGTKFFCLVKHTETGVTLRESVTMVSPMLLHPVPMRFDWLSEEVLYSSYDQTSNANDAQSVSLPGLVQMKLHPSSVVKKNSSVTVTVTSNGCFPEPTYTWWSENFNLNSEKTVTIPSLEQNQLLYCVVENPVGRVVLSVELIATNPDPVNSTSNTNPYIDDIAISGLLVGAIAFGSLVLLLLITFLIYYCAFKTTDTKPVAANDGDDDDFESYTIKEKLPESDQPTGQTKVIPLSYEEETPITNENQSLLNESLNYTKPSNEILKKSALESGSTSTSGYDDDLGGSNGVESRHTDSKSHDNKKRAISEHLMDFDENASFVGGYGSTFGLDQKPSQVAGTLSSNILPAHSDEEDSESFDSRSSGFEGRYTLPHESADRIGSDLVEADSLGKPTKV